MKVVEEAWSNKRFVKNGDLLIIDHALGKYTIQLHNALEKPLWKLIVMKVRSESNTIVFVESIYWK